MQLDVTQALKDTENALRDFISATLEKALGSDWLEKSGVAPERVAKWRERKETEHKRQEVGAVDERLIYYADFYDLKTILKKHWQVFSPALGELKTFDVWLSELEKLRDPDAHRRELLPHQKHLALGIEGEIRTRIVRYRSKQETADDYFPRIESVRDNYGNVYPSDTWDRPGNDTILRPGDKLEWVVTARDPLEEPLEFQIACGDFDGSWQSDNALSYMVREEDVSEDFQAFITIRSGREFHANREYDDLVQFCYQVLPVRRREIK